ncbi:MAG: RdgB/HAM1 family non-canonical purine NTP pyrophosphatase [Candidatus Micrarchaeia archaeon]
MTALSFVTSNKHKFSEAKSILKAYGVKIEPLNLDIDEIRSESCRKVAENAAKAAFAIARRPLFVEDAGLFVDALEGFPGTFSAWAYGKIGNAGLLRLMKGEKNRRARFASAIAYCDGSTSKSFEAECAGSIAGRIAGPHGFGYDPVFIPANSRRTFAEAPEEKQNISHRRKALAEFAKWYSSYVKKSKG